MKSIILKSIALGVCISFVITGCKEKESTNNLRISEENKKKSEASVPLMGIEDINPLCKIGLLQNITVKNLRNPGDFENRIYLKLDVKTNNVYCDKTKPSSLLEMPFCGFFDAPSPNNQLAVFSHARPERTPLMSVNIKTSELQSNVFLEDCHNGDDQRWLKIQVNKEDESKGWLIVNKSTKRLLTAVPMPDENGYYYMNVVEGYKYSENENYDKPFYRSEGSVWEIDIY